MKQCFGKRLSALLRGITTQHLNSLHVFGTERKRESLKIVCQDKDFS